MRTISIHPGGRRAAPGWSQLGRDAGATSVVLVALSLGGFPGSAWAANFIVNSSQDAVDVTPGCQTPGATCTLRAAIQDANAVGGSSTITLPAGIYKLMIPPSGADDITTGDLNVSANVTINGAGAASTIIDGGGGPSVVTDRVMRVEASGNLTLTGLTVQKGHPPGALSKPNSEGGGILALGPLSMSDVVVSGNTVDTPGGFGAGIAQEGTSVPLSLARVTVSNNTINVSAGKSGSGGGLIMGAAGTSPLTVSDSTISDNNAAGAGGGVYVRSTNYTSPINITGTTISHNHAVLPSGLTTPENAYGGGLATDGSQVVTLTNDAITDNTADQAGGGILDNASSAYTITDTTISRNTAVAGVVFQGTTLGAGGIAADGGNISPGWMLSGDTISGNTAGSISNPNVPGGGIDEDGGDRFTLVNTTIVGNTATGLGGGYESSGGGTHKLTNVTIDANTAGSGGGNIDLLGGRSFSLANSIVARGAPANCGGSIRPTSLGHNLDTGASCALGAAGDRSNQINPGLGPLSANGGPTQTEALLPGSPAIDAGDNALCPASDQRGVTRPQNGVCDIGAFELVFQAPTGGGGVSPLAPAPPGAPSVATAPPTVASTRSAGFSAAVNPNGAPTTMHFEYGLDTSYGSVTAEQAVGSDRANHTVVAKVSGLLPNSRYHVRAVATNGAGSAFGNDQTFKTASDPRPGKPRLGKSVNIEPVSGEVFVKPPPGATLAGVDVGAPHSSARGPYLKGRGFILLTEARQIPVGSTLDTTAGAVRLTTATASRATQIGDFTAGIFTILQARQQRGLTNLNLIDAHSARQVCAAAGKAQAARRHLSSSVLGLLSGSAQGRFTTRGRYSAATVRGTKWSVSDRCDGTLTRVTRGVVVVRDFRQQTNVTVRAGKSYLAKAPGG